MRNSSDTRPRVGRNLLSHFHPRYLVTLLYMAQITEYNGREFWAYLRRTKDFSEVMKRGRLDWTHKARLLFLWLLAGGLLCLAGVALLTYFALALARWWLLGLALLLFLLTPWLLQIILWATMQIGYILVQRPVERLKLQQVRARLAANKAVKIAVLGSYGKTTAKAVLEQMLGGEVKATPGNINQPLGFARFIEELSGDEKVLIFEFGEGTPGDIRRMARLVRPDYAVLTGVAEAHLAAFGSLRKIITTFNEIRDFVPKNRLFLNADSPILARQKGIGYSMTGVGDLHVRKVKLAAFSTSFEVNKTEVTTGLIGEHNIGIVTLVGRQRCGLSSIAWSRSLSKRRC